MTGAGETSGMSGGRYQILRKLAQGGMAELFLGQHTSVAGFKRTVAIKRVLPEHAADPLFVESFFNEARLAAQLNHPNIVQIYDLARDDKTYFMVMEYIRGYDLEALLKVQRERREPLPLAVALQVVIDLCRGLHFAHQAKDENGLPLGIVHRDISPSNVIVMQTGSSKVVDFGIAKATAQNDSRTSTGVLKGKMCYVAPEQVLGHPIDHRVDVFATGIVLYEVLCNNSPFRGDSTYASLHNIAQGTYRPLIEARPGLPDGLYDLVTRALAVDRSQRLQTCAEIEQGLLRIAAEAHLSVTPDRVAQHMREHLQQLKVQAPNAAREESAESDVSLVLDLHVVTESDIVGNSNVTRGSTKSSRKRSFWPLALAGLLLISAAVTWALQRRAQTPPQAPALVETATLEIVSSPPGANVLIDGVWHTGVTPLALEGFAVGAQPEVTVVMAGMTSQRERVALDAPGRRSFAFALSPAPAAATAGEGHDSAPERSTVAARRERATELTGERRSERAMDQPAEARPAPEAPPVHAPPPAPEPDGDGKLRIIVEPWGTVTIDGRLIGDTPFPVQTLPAGKHTILIENARLGKKVSKPVTVRANQEVSLHHDFLGD